MNPLISIIIPVYNSEKYLDFCIKSVVNQTYTNLEIILVDDGSSDGSPIICDSWHDRDNRIVVIHKSNGGVSSARNRGLLQSNGELILFLDSDDYVEENMLAIMMQYLTKDKDTIIFTGFDRVKSSQICKVNSLDSTPIYKKVNHIKDFYSVRNGFFCVGMLVPRRVIQDNSAFFDETLINLEDVVWVGQLIDIINDFCYIDLNLYHY